jgi:hypothetical protein
VFTVYCVKFGRILRPDHRETLDRNFTNYLISSMLYHTSGVIRDHSCNSCLRPDHSDQITQFVFNVAGSSNRVGNFLAQ